MIEKDLCACQYISSSGRNKINTSNTKTYPTTSLAANAITNPTKTTGSAYSPPSQDF